MKNKCLAVIELLRGSFWFVPAIMVACSIILAIGVVKWDQAAPSSLTPLGLWAYRGNAEGARSVLATIAAAMVTVAGVVFSISIVALSQAAAQFGPRLLRNFMRNRGNQLVLGTFVSVFIYCLLVLLTVQGQGEHAFVPIRGLTVAMGLALLGTGVLVFFIHHAAASLQPNQIVSEIASELKESIEKLPCREKANEVLSAASLTQNELFKDHSSELTEYHCSVCSKIGGYVLAIELDSMLEIAEKHQLWIVLLYRPGQFVAFGSKIARLWSNSTIDEAVVQQLQDQIALGRQRTAIHDLEFLVSQLVEIALRALSPGINDPFTVMTSVDRLGEAMQCLAKRRMPLAHRYGRGNILRIVGVQQSFPAMLDIAFNAIRQYGAGSVPVTTRVLANLAAIADVTESVEDINAVVEHAQALYHDARSRVVQAKDKEELEGSWKSVGLLLAQQRLKLASKP